MEESRIVIIMSEKEEIIPIERKGTPEIMGTFIGRGCIDVLESED